MNFKYKLMQFMSGRYGIDTMFYLLFAIAAVLAVLNCFFRSLLLQLLVYAIIVYAFYRVLSRNTSARARENRFAVQVADKAKSRLEAHRRYRADTTHIYKKCPHCRAVLRLPRRKGKHETVCPKCSTKFKVRVYKE